VFSPRDTLELGEQPGGAIDPQVAIELSRLARELQASDETEAILQRIVDAAVSEIRPAQHAGVTVASKTAVWTAAKSSGIAAELDVAQCRTGDGPCLTTLREHHSVRVDDFSAEARWPKFAAAAVENGVLSSLSVQLFVEDDDIGALNLYSARRSAFSDADQGVALLLASQASVAVAASRKIGNLRIALESRDVIGQAKGILMERFKVSADEAFALLITASQQTHRKLNQIAEELTMTGELTLPPGRR